MASKCGVCKESLGEVCCTNNNGDNFCSVKCADIDEAKPKVHEIDGKQFVEVDRKAEVGERIVIIRAGQSFGDYAKGDIFRVQFIGNEDGSVIVEDYGVEKGHVCCLINRDEYRVLEPVEPAKSIVDILANLSQKLVELEKRIVELESDLSEITFTPAQVESIIRMTSGGAND